MCKKSLIVFLILVFAFSGLSFAKSKTAIPKVVMLGIGAKNPTLDESRFPHLNFYYTPGLVSKAQVSSNVKALAALSGIAKETFEGEPKLLADIWNEKGEVFMLFDNQSVCATLGYNILQQDDILKRLCADRKSLADNFKLYVKKGKTVKPAKKAMKLKKSDFMVGHKFPNFQVSDPSGNITNINTVLSGQPTLVILFQLSPDLDINAAKESQAEASGKAFAKAMLAGAAGGKATGLFEQIEGQLFGYDAREK